MVNRLHALVRLAALGAALLMAGQPHAQSYPVKPVTIVTILGPGADTWNRVLAAKLAEILGQPFIVDNRPGASGTLAVQAVTKAAPDGHTLAVHSPAYLIAKNVQPNLPWDPITELVPVVKAFDSGAFALMVSAESQAKNLDDLVARLRSSQGKMGYASAGIGLPQHLMTEALLKVTQTQALHVPFKGQDAYAAVLRGDVDFTISSLTTGMPQVRAGKMRVLGITTPRRLSQLPDVPTFREVLKSDLLVMEFWAGLAAPAKTPDAVVRAIHAATQKALLDPGVRKSIEAGMNTVALNESPEEFAALVRRDNERYREMVQRTGIRAE